MGPRRVVRSCRCSLAGVDLNRQWSGCVKYVPSCPHHLYGTLWIGASPFWIWCAIRVAAHAYACMHAKCMRVRRSLAPRRCGCACATHVRSHFHRHKHPTIFWLKQYMNHVRKVEKRTVLLYCDFHGHSRCR